jgi:DoxX-like family
MFESKGALWLGRAITAIMTLLFVFDGGSKVLALPFMVEGMKQAGLDPSLLLPIGLAALIPAILYAIPYTSILGAVLLTGFLGGAMAAHLKDPVQLPHDVMILMMGGFVWLGLWLRDPRLRALIPFNSNPSI